MPIDTRHPDYLHKRYTLMRATAEGEDAVKKLTTQVLSKPSGIALAEKSGDADKMAKAKIDWENYLFRADFTDLIGATTDGLVGLAFKNKWTFELGSRLGEMMEKRATPDGRTLDQLAVDVVRESLLTARQGLLSDNHGNFEDRKTPLISTYTAENIWNWGSDDDISFRVLREQKRKTGADRYAHDTEDHYRELLLEDGKYSVFLHSPNEEKKLIQQPVIEQGLQKRMIPFVVVGAKSLDIDVDHQIPLWPMAKCLLKAYQVSADYQQVLHMTSQPTLFFKMFGDSVPNVAGAMTTVHSNDKDADGKYIEFMGKGAEALHREIERKINQAMLYSHHLQEKSSGVESGQALSMRVQAKTATLQSVVNNAAAGLEQALKNCALWASTNPDEVKVTPNTKFSDSDIEANLLKVLGEQVRDNIIPEEDYNKYRRSIGLTELEDSEIKRLLTAQQAKAENKLLESFEDDAIAA